jgi:hypothetical protein
MSDQLTDSLSERLIDKFVSSMTKNLTDLQGELSDGRAYTLPHLLINSLPEKPTDSRKALLTSYVIDTCVAGSRRRTLNTTSTTKILHFVDRASCNDSW